LVVLATVVVAVLGVLALPAGAQDDPYGSTTTTAGAVAGAQVTCDLTITEGQAGAGVTATVAGVSSGTTVRVLFGGIEVGRAATPVQGQSGTALAIPFVIPEVSPGEYLVTAVGPDFTTTCATDVGVVSVLGATVTRGAQRGGGALPRTGIYVALFLVIALVLLLVGRALLESSRRRRRAADGGPPTADQADAHRLRRPAAK
jgi:hypothetical protein